MLPSYPLVLYFFMYTGNNLDNYVGQRKIDIDVAGKASYNLSNLTSLPSFLEAHHPYIALHFHRKYFWVLFLLLIKL